MRFAGCGGKSKWLTEEDIASKYKAKKKERVSEEEEEGVGERESVREQEKKGDTW